MYAYLISIQKRRRWRSERNKTRSNHDQRLSPYPYYSVPESVLAKFLNISESTAHEYKLLAEKAGYIRVYHKFSKIGKGFQVTDRIRKDNPRIRKTINGYCIQDPDKIEPCCTLKIRKKIEA